MIKAIYLKASVPTCVYGRIGIYHLHWKEGGEVTYHSDHYLGEQRASRGSSTVTCMVLDTLNHNNALAIQTVNNCHKGEENKNQLLCVHIFRLLFPSLGSLYLMFCARPDHYGELLNFYKLLFSQEATGLSKHAWIFVSTGGMMKDDL